MARIVAWLARPGLLLTLISRLRLASRLLREPRVQGLAKALPALAAIYLVWPLDVIPDICPWLGQLDDLGIVLMTVEGFLRICPPAAVEFHRSAIAGGRGYTPMPARADVIDAEFRRE